MIIYLMAAMFTYIIVRNTEEPTGVPLALLLAIAWPVSLGSLLASIVMGDLHL